MKLVVVESPTKARTLNKFLGEGFSIVATMGHIKDLPKSKLGIDIEGDFKPDYIEVEKRKKEIEKLTKEALKAEKVYLATDPDREGEAIALHISEILKEKKCKISKENLKRVVFYEITKSAVKDALQTPRDIDSDLVNAQIARRVLDRIVGYELSPLLWKKIRRGLSAGRVQSVTVRLIVEREREIEAFKQEEYWEIFVNLRKDKNFDVKLKKINGKNTVIKNRKEADLAVDDLQKSQYEVFDVRKKEVRKGPYPPFTTSTMTQASSRLFGWSARKTMSFAQKLYEEGFITYHRTDSTSLATGAVNKARKFISETYGEKYIPENPRFFKTKSKSAQEAHEAIRPTNVNTLNVGKNTLVSEKLYQLVWKRFVACQMADSVYDETKIDVLAFPEEKKGKYLLSVSGQVNKFKGWRKVIPGGKKEDETNLPEVFKKDKLDLVGIDPKQKFTQPPARYNEASIIKTLEKLGIGRPSTYAPVITTIQTRQYVEKEEGKFKPTIVGTTVNDFLVKHFPFVFDYMFTASMEDDLDNVARGKKEWRKIMKKFYKPFKEKLIKVQEKSKRVKIETEKTGKKCPTCKKGDVVIRVGRFGKFISCDRFPDCDYKGRYEDKIGMKCPECEKGDVVIKKTRRGRKFFGCSKYPDCNWASWTDPKRKENK